MGSFTDFNSGVDNSYNVSSLNKVRSGTNKLKDAGKKDTNYMMAYLTPDASIDPSSISKYKKAGYNANKSRFGTWWEGYQNAYDTLMDAGNNYRQDFNTTFDETRPFLDTGELQGEWSNYKDRMMGYYGDARTAIDDWIDKDAYDLWGDLATGDNQSSRVQDWFSLSPQGQYLSDQANENFWRQAQLGGQTYNPQDVNNYISQSIVAPEMWKAYDNLAQYAQFNAASSQQLEQWYAQAVASGDMAATEAIVDLMNQQNQQQYQHDMSQGLSDSQMRYILEGAMPANKTMDYTNQQLGTWDAQNIVRLAGNNRNALFDYFKSTAAPLAFNSAAYGGNLYNAAIDNQGKAAGANLLSAGIGALGGALGGI